MALPINAATLPLVIGARWLATLFRLRGTEVLFRFLFPPGVMPPRSFEVYIEDLRYRGSTAHFIDWNILLYGAYEEDDLLMMKTFARADDVDVFLDIGANLGQHAIYLSGAVKRVIAFEPNARLHQQFRDNMTRNGIGNIDMHALAMGGADGAGTLYLGDDSGGSSLLASANCPGNLMPTDVVVRAGDSFLEEQFAEAKVGLIKIDVEGYEAQVLKGLAETIHANRPVVAIEISDAGREQFGSAEKFAASFPRAYTFYMWHKVGTIRRRSEIGPSPLEAVFAGYGNIYAVPWEKRDRFEHAAARRPSRMRHRRMSFVRML